MKLRNYWQRFYLRVAQQWYQAEHAVMEERAVMAAILILAVLASLTQLGDAISSWFTQVANAY